MNQHSRNLRITWFGQGFYDCEIMTPRKAVNILTIHGQNTNGIPLQFVCVWLSVTLCVLWDSFIVFFHLAG